MKSREERLPHERLLQVLEYEPETGNLRWRKVTSNRIKVGDIAGQEDRHGHLLINVDGTRYMAHRLVWFYCTGDWPKDEIDHINLIKDDNRIENLREATRAENCRNVARKRHNKSGFKGVVRHPQAKHLFMAQITIGGRPKYLGLFKTPEQAHEAYVKASEQHHGEFGRRD
jgi:hypothetical protein